VGLTRTARPRHPRNLTANLAATGDLRRNHAWLPVPRTALAVEAKVEAARDLAARRGW